MAKSIKQVRRKLELSKLEGQRQLLSKDLDLTQLAFITKNLPAMRFDEAVTDGDITRTIEGASTVQVTVNDHYGIIRRSGRLARTVDIKVDGLWFRLVKVQKTGDQITLTFESREIAVLRTYNERRVIGWGKMRRARFAQILVQEPKEFRIPFICPDLMKPKDKKDKADKAANRDPGFGFNTNASQRADAGRTHSAAGSGLKIDGKPANSNQLNNIEEVLDVGLSMLLVRKLLVCSIMTVIQESKANNLPFGDRDSVGMFQQRPSQGWTGLMNIPKAAREFFEKAAAFHRGNPKAEYWEVCQAVQISGYPKAYAQWRAESERIVTAYGIAGNDFGTNKDVSDANLMTEWEEESGVDKFQFMRGRPKKLAGGRTGWEKEDSWTCITRLANEVNWRCFEVSGSVYFTTEVHLFKSAPRARLSEGSEGVNWIDFDYDIGKRNASVTVSAYVDRWKAPPGTIIELFGCGPVNGRWLVSEIKRPFFDTLATITLKKPRPRLPEPKKEDLTGLWDNSLVDNSYVPTPGFVVDPIGKQPKGSALRQAVLDNPSITFTRDSQKSDIITGKIDERVLRFLIQFTEAGFPATISSLRSDHGKYSRPGVISDHFRGEAVDIKNYDIGNSRTRTAMTWIGTNQISLGFSELIGPVDELVIPLGDYDEKTLKGHDNHIHVGF